MRSRNEQERGVTPPHFPAENDRVTGTVTAEQELHLVPRPHSFALCYGVRAAEPRRRPLRRAAGRRSDSLLDDWVWGSSQGDFGLPPGPGGPPRRSCAATSARIMASRSACMACSRSTCSCLAISAQGERTGDCVRQARGGNKRSRRGVLAVASAPSSGGGPGPIPQRGAADGPARGRSWRPPFGIAGDFIAPGP